MPHTDITDALKMMRIFLILALLAAVQCRITGRLFHTDYKYGREPESEPESSESSSESSIETSSKTSSCEETPSDPPPCPCTPLDVRQCCDDCPYCKDEHATCVTYGYGKMCICNTNFTFDYEFKKCVPGDPPPTHGLVRETRDQMMQALELAMSTQITQKITNLEMVTYVRLDLYRNTD